MTETTITKENFMYQIPPDELLYEWFREAQTSETKKFTVRMYDDGGYATNAYDVILRVVEWCNSHKELTVTEPTKPIPTEQSVARTQRGTTITKEELDRLWNALEYTRATISPGCRFELSDAKDSLKDDWCAIHKGRAESSYRFMDQAIDFINEKRRELK